MSRILSEPNNWTHLKAHQTAIIPKDKSLKQNSNHLAIRSGHRKNSKVIKVEIVRGVSEPNDTAVNTVIWIQLVWGLWWHVTNQGHRWVPLLLTRFLNNLHHHNFSIHSTKIKSRSDKRLRTSWIVRHYNHHLCSKSTNLSRLKIKSPITTPKVCSISLEVMVAGTRLVLKSLILKVSRARRIGAIEL